MAVQIPSKFEDFKWDNDNEEMVAKTFNSLNRMYLVKLRTELMHVKLGQKFDPKHPDEFLQNDAYVAGEIAILNMLIGD